MYLIYFNTIIASIDVCTRVLVSMQLSTVISIGATLDREPTEE